MKANNLRKWEITAMRALCDRLIVGAGESARWGEHELSEVFQAEARAAWRLLVRLRRRPR